MRSLCLIPNSREGTDESTLLVEWQPVSRSISGVLSEYTQETLIFRRVSCVYCQRAHRWHGPGAEQVRLVWVMAEALGTARVPTGMSHHPLQQQ